MPKVIFPTFEANPSTDGPKPVVRVKPFTTTVKPNVLEKFPKLYDEATRRARDQIMAQEDQSIFDVLDDIAGVVKCKDPSHTAYRKPISECIETSCMLREVHDS